MPTNEHQSPVYRAEGVTNAERHLQKLCDHSFLSLWSYPNIYRDQDYGKGEGKEICDLLVVFHNHVLLFSDKDCVFPNTDSLELNWSRWFRRAILQSAEQLWGAERWLKSHPNRIFLDRACIHQFPLEFPDWSTAKVHRILVAHGASNACRGELGGTGSLRIVPRIIGEDHCKKVEEGGRPFTIGQINPTKGYIHVFDDISLEILMDTLDTITDFVNYLSKKEQFISSGKLGAADGEEELLSYYLQHLDEREEHDFPVPSDIDAIYIDKGFWEKFSNGPQRKSQLIANKSSYAWDALIETFNKHISQNTEYYTSAPGIKNQEKYIRFLAREPRTRRRMLINALFGLIKKTNELERGVRVILPSNSGDPYYVFLLLPPLEEIKETKYREGRRKHLEEYCLVVKLKFPDAEDIIGIATEPGMNEYRSEDVVYYDARNWSSEEEMEARILHEDLGLLKNTTRSHNKEYEFPLKRSPAPNPQEVIKVKYGGNWPCPCGRPKKYKRCCGRQN